MENKNYDLIITGTNISINPSLNIYFGTNNLANYNNEMYIENALLNIEDTINLFEKLINNDNISFISFP